MNCGIHLIKWLIFIFNFIFVLCGLAILSVGIIIHVRVKIFDDILQENVMFPGIALIVVGAIIFTVAFFGCCGAVRESHCMIVTFAMLLLTILVIQVAVAIFAFVKLHGMGPEIIKEPYVKSFDKYYTDRDSKELIDYVQHNFECCGINNYRDWNQRHGQDPPASCCARSDDKDQSPCTQDQYATGCLDKTLEIFKDAGKLVGGLAIGIAAIEFVGVIFALCLANSIRNAERRGYGV